MKLYIVSTIILTEILFFSKRILILVGTTYKYKKPLAKNKSQVWVNLVLEKPSRLKPDKWRRARKARESCTMKDGLLSVI